VLVAVMQCDGALCSRMRSRCAAESQVLRAAEVCVDAVREPC
jgi:hypothetical protein